MIIPMTAPLAVLLARNAKWKQEIFLIKAIPFEKN